MLPKDHLALGRLLRCPLPVKYSGQLKDRHVFQHLVVSRTRDAGWQRFTVLSLPGLGLIDVLTVHQVSLRNPRTIVAFSDSDFGGDNETRISVAGFIIYLMGVPISLKSEGQKIVALSSSEAEYIATLGAATEIKVFYQILISLNFNVNCQFSSMWIIWAQFL